MSETVNNSSTETNNVNVNIPSDDFEVIEFELDENYNIIAGGKPKHRSFEWSHCNESVMLSTQVKWPSVNAQIHRRERRQGVWDFEIGHLGLSYSEVWICFVTYFVDRADDSDGLQKPGEGAEVGVIVHTNLEITRYRGRHSFLVFIEIGYSKAALGIKVNE